MRSIPSDIKAKLLKRFQADGTDSRPQMSIISEQPSIATLSSEIIHSGTVPNNGDVAIRQLKSSGPDYVYALCLDAAMMKVYGRSLSISGYETEWEHLWTLGAAIDVAIEFNGTWQKGSGKDYYFMITDEFPWLFWVDESGILWAQHWQDQSTNIQLDTGVSSVSAVRGWQSTLTPTDDQGLVVAYIKNKKAYYRAYCLETNGSISWETAQQLTSFTQDVMSLQAFRTNDYRIGFIAEVAVVGAEVTDGIQYILSHRQYVGGSVTPEYFDITIPKVKFGLIPITTQNAYVPSEKVTAHATNLRYFGYISSTAVALSFTAVRDSTTQFTLTFNYTIGVNDGTNLASLLTVNYVSVATATTISNNTIQVTVSTAIQRNVAVTINLAACLEAWFIVEDWKQPLTAASASITAETVTLTAKVPTETITTQATTASCALIPIVTYKPLVTETLIGQTINVVFAFVQTGNVPI